MNDSKTNGPLLRPWSPTTEAAKVEFAELMRTYANQIPTEKGINAWMAFRDMIGAMFPGQMPAPAAIAIMTVISANAISSMTDQMESTLEFDTPGAVGRRAAVAEFFAAILDHAANHREELRLNKMFAGAGVAGQRPS